MSIKGTTKMIRERLAAQLSANGVPCLEYDTWTMGSPQRAALGVDPSWSLALSPQGGRVDALTIPVLVYAPITNDIPRSQGIAEQAVEDIVDALVCDTSIGSTVSGITLEGQAATTSLYRDQNGQLILVVNVPVTVFPLPIT